MAEELNRGDEISDELPPSTIDDSKPELDSASEVEKSDDEIEAEKLAEEKPRDENGKFTKKEREVPDHVPKARFDDAVGKERAAREAAEARAAALEAQVMREAESADIKQLTETIKDLNRQQNKLLLDGESEKAAEIQDKVQELIEQRAELKSEARAAMATSQAVEQVRMEAAIAKLEADFPAFNPESDDFDQDLVDLVLAEQARMIRTDRVMPSKALISSAEKIMKKFAPLAAEPTGKGLGAAKGADRKAEQVSKNLDTARRQPGSMKGVGKDSDKGGEGAVNIGTMTQAEINALPESTKAKLRGDFL